MSTLHSRHRMIPRLAKALELSDQLSQAQAAAALGVSRAQVNRWVRAGALRDRDVLGVSRISVEEVLTFAKRSGRTAVPLGRLLGLKSVKGVIGDATQNAH